MVWLGTDLSSAPDEVRYCRAQTLFCAPVVPPNAGSSCGLARWAPRGRQWHRKQTLI
jgi:hypothetical protein